jgi:hypothetical protein
MPTGARRDARGQRDGLPYARIDEDGERIEKSA